MCNYITDQLRWCDFNCHKWERFVTTNYTKSTTDHAMWQIWSSSHLTSNITWFVPICCHCLFDRSFIVMTISPFAIILRRYLWLMATSDCQHHVGGNQPKFVTRVPYYTNLVRHFKPLLFQIYKFSKYTHIMLKNVSESCKKNQNRNGWGLRAQRIQNQWWKGGLVPR